MKRKKWSELSLAKKLVLEIALTAAVLFACNLFIYWRINSTFQEMDSIYGSNVSLSELSDALEQVNQSTYEYLSMKSSNALEDYYSNTEDFCLLYEKLNDKNIDNPVKILEKNIRNMSENYLLLTDEAVQAKRGRNVAKYKQCYNEAEKLYGYINHYIYNLNSKQFKNNAANYESMQDAMGYIEITSAMILLLVVAVGIILLAFTTAELLKPLRNLADTAHLVGQGDFNVKVPQVRSEDEIGVVTKAFNTMVDSLKTYMEKTRKSMEKELLMEAHLKEAKLKFYQSQINPHFLFNSLNAGAQLAMMEDADRTCLFMEKMADFFRYNVKKSWDDAVIREEVEAVNNYIYILNVRFAGDIGYECQVDSSVEDFHVPSMILQPLVENAVNHGIRNVEWDGLVELNITKEQSQIKISIKDNGQGITKEKIEEILKGVIKTEDSETDSTGVGINNVKSRLELYYGRTDIFHIYSEGKNKGTEIVLLLPMEEEK